MKTASHGMASEVIHRLRKHASDKSDVTLIRERENDCLKQILFDNVVIAAAAWYGFSEPIFPFWAVCLLIVWHVWSLIRRFRELVRIRAVRVLFESAGPQFLNDLGIESRQG